MNLFSLIAAAAAITAAASASAATSDELAALINGYRTAPGVCNGARPAPVAPLTPQAALARIELRPASILIAELDRLGYQADLADAIQVSGPTDVRDAYAALLERHCGMLLSAQYSAIGVSQRGNTWTVVLAQPAPDLALILPPWPEVGRQILAAANAARARPQECGAMHMPPAPPLAWNEALSNAAHEHSADMARQRYFSHKAKDGSEPGDRARAAGYIWRRVGENISSGQISAQEAVAGWLSSPGHCVNLMNPDFRDMGAAYAIREGKRPSAYWTQVFGTR